MPVPCLHWENSSGACCSLNPNEPERFQPVVRDVKIDFKAPATTDVIAEAFFSEDQHQR